MPQLITQNVIKGALRSHRDREPKDLTDTKVDGLQIRVRLDYCRWRIRGTLHGKQKSYDLGPVMLDAEPFDGGVSLNDARSRGAKVREMLRANMNPDAQVAAWAAGVSLEQTSALQPHPS
jgi:hypothetical protein